MIAVEQQSQLEHIVYCRDTVHGYSKSIGKLMDLVVNFVEDAEKAVRNGKNAIWAGGGWEMPLLYASGTIPVAYSEMGRISGKDAIAVAEDHYQVPAETCSMVKATIGEWYLRRNSGIKRIFGNSAGCEPFNLAWELMKKEGYDVYTIDVVYRAPGVQGERYDQLLKYFISEIHDLSEWLTGSRKINDDRLGLEIRRKNYLMRKMRRIMEFRLKHPFYVRSLAVMYLINGLSHYFGKPEEYTEVVDGLLDELERLPESKEERDAAIPLVWAGGNGQEFGIYEAIDDANGALLGFVTTPYIRDYREDVSPVESLARFLLDSQMAGASVYRRHAIEQQVNKINARGLILYGYLGCSFGSVAREMFRDYFHKKGIPSINLEGTFQVGAPTGQILTRIKAFIEMLS
jgi:benzoyl-CoA reductase/2-hydroxyglutaryl-CoA dehydratase subunit BcrC/BadD/HgdB